MSSSGYPSGLARIMSFKGLASQLACADCNRCTNCFCDAPPDGDADKDSEANVSDPTTAGNYGMATEDAAPTTAPVNGAMNGPNTSPATELQITNTWCCCGERTSSTPPISECSTCTRVLRHHPFSLLQQIDELFPDSMESQLGNGQVEDLTDWEFPSGHSFDEFAALAGGRISPTQLFFDGSRADDPWILRHEVMVEDFKNYPGDCETWMK